MSTKQKYRVQCSLPEQKKLKALSEIPLVRFQCNILEFSFNINGNIQGKYEYRPNGQSSYRRYTQAEAQTEAAKLGLRIDFSSREIFLPVDSVFTIHKAGHGQSRVTIYGTRKDNPKMPKWTGHIATDNLTIFEVIEV